MLRSEKKQFVEDLENLYKNNDLVIIAHYHGLTVAQMTNLRKSLREKNANLKVVKNTLAILALSRQDDNKSKNLYAGPTVMIYSDKSFDSAKVVVNFAKNNDRLKIIGGVVNNVLINSAGVEQLAILPSLDELRSTIISLMQASAAKLVGVTKAPAAQIAMLLQAHVDKN